MRSNLTLVLLLLLLPSQLLMAEDYASIFKKLVGSHKIKSAADFLEQIDDPVDFAASLTVGQIMLMPPETQQLFMRSIPVNILHNLLLRDGIDITPHLPNIDFTDAKILTLVENYFLVMINDCLEDIQIASESQWDTQVLAFRGPLIRDKYLFYRGNLLNAAMGLITDFFRQIEKSHMPISTRFLEGLTRLIQQVSTAKIVSTFEAEHAVNVYPVFVNAYLHLIQSAALLAAQGEIIDDTRRDGFVSTIRSSFKDPLEHILNFVNQVGPYEPFNAPLFHDERKFSDQDEQNEWDWLYGSIEDYHSKSPDPHIEELDESITDGNRDILDDDFKNNMKTAAFDIKSLQQELFGYWNRLQQNYWSDHLSFKLGDERFYIDPKETSTKETASLLNLLAKRHLNDFQAPAQIIVDTMKTPNIVIFKSSNASNTLYYPSELDQAAEQYINDYAVNHGLFPYAINSFKRIIQMGWSSNVLTQGAFTQQQSNPSKTSYAAAFEGNPIDWSEEQADPSIVFSVDNFEVYLQPEIYRDHAIAVIENETQWQTSKKNAEKLAAESGVDISDVPLVDIIGAISNAVKKDNPNNGVYNKKPSDIIDEKNGLHLEDQNNCLSLFENQDLRGY